MKTREERSRRKQKRNAAWEKSQAETHEQILTRFMSRVAKSPDGCWLWTGPPDHTQYGLFTYRGRTRGAHRASLELHKGPIAPGLRALHTCDVPICVNPNHLYQGTALDNARDAKERRRFNPWNRGLTHCKRGHEFTTENTGRNGPAGDRRKCKKCLSDSGKRRREATRAALAPKGSARGEESE